MDNKYIKVIHQSEPIGKERIILYLTTFDLEAFEKDEKLEKIPEKKQAIAFEFDRTDLLNNSNLINEFENRFEDMFKKVYEKQLLDMKSYIELNRKLSKASWYEVEN